MQVEIQGSGHSGSNDALGSGLFLFTHEGRRVVATRPQTYLSAVVTCRRLFPQIPENSEIRFQSNDLSLRERDLAEISPESFELMVPRVTSLVVNAVVQVSGGLDPQTQPRRMIFLNIHMEGRALPHRLQILPSMNIVTALRQVPALEEQWDHWRFFNGRTGKRLTEGTFSSEDLQQDDRIDCHLCMTGGKPVIYLSSPREIEATVRLSLVPQWSLSAIYPVVPSKPRSASSHEQVEWRVRAHPNGDLTELITGLDVAYLFWEAHTNPHLPISPPPSPVPGQARSDNFEDFNPVMAVLTDDNSVVLPVASITLYLDRALKALGLHTEARTSFITYWLPSILKHKYVALRFVPQSAYEKAAPLDITPQPDNITRVFMLFQGVEEEELIDWKHAQANSIKDVAFWADVAGVDLEQALDPTIFRVLEWGGMEVLRSKPSLVED